MPTKTFNFQQPERPATLMLTDAAGYLNAKACRMLLAEGKYAEIKFDVEAQAIRIQAVSEPGAWRYKIIGDSGSPIQLRNRLTKEGMHPGIYIYIGSGIFQHVDHLSND